MKNAPVRRALVWGFRSFVHYGAGVPFFLIMGSLVRWLFSECDLKEAFRKGYADWQDMSLPEDLFHG